MTRLLDDVARDVSRALKDAFLSCVYTETATDTLNATTGDFSSRATVNHRCRAIIEDYGAYYFANSLVEDGDRKVTVLARTLRITPKTGDKVTICGDTRVIVAVSRDPTGATWTLQVR